MDSQPQRDVDNPTGVPDPGGPVLVVDPVPHPLGERFAAHAATEVGWLGGDSTIAVEVGGGERLWLFSDTMLAGDRWVHNCAVVEHIASGELRTVLGGTATAPGALVEPAAAVAADGLSRWLWAGGGIASEGGAACGPRRVWVFYQEFRATVGDQARGEWDFAWVRTVLVELSWPQLRVLSRCPLEDGTGVQWGAAVHRHGRELFVYGVADHGTRKDLLVASTPTAQPGRWWRYYTGDGWSPRAGDAARVLTGVSNEVSVVAAPGRDGGWVLVTSDTRSELGSWPIVAYYAPHPAGPWSGPQHVLDPPENTGSSYAYNPTLVPLADHRFLLAYNVNAAFHDVMADHSIYRPHFRTVGVYRTDLAPRCPVRLPMAQHGVARVERRSFGCPNATI